MSPINNLNPRNKAEAKEKSQQTWKKCQNTFRLTRFFCWPPRCFFLFLFWETSHLWDEVDPGHSQSPSELEHCRFLEILIEYWAVDHYHHHHHRHHYHHHWILSTNIIINIIIITSIIFINIIDFCSSLIQMLPGRKNAQLRCLFQTHCNYCPLPLCTDLG